MEGKSLVLLGVQTLLAVSAGVATAYQPGMNAKFASIAGHRMHGGVLNFVVGAVGLLLVAAAMRVGPPTAAAAMAAPWWSWFGGLLGAYFVVMALTLVPEMGAGSYLTAMILGQLVASVVIDHFGQMGLSVQPISAGKLVGIVLVMIGVACVRLL